MIRAIFRDGQIQPLDPLPTGWEEGQELQITEDEPSDEPEAIERWARELSAIANRPHDPADWERFRIGPGRGGSTGQRPDATRNGPRMMGGFLADTNHLGAALRPVSLVRDRIEQERRAGARIGTCVPVLCELEVGIRQLGRQQEVRRDLKSLMTQVRVWPIDPSIVASYGEIYLDLRRRGRVLSSVDIMLAALARTMGLTLLTTDRDFEALPSIRTEDWTVAATP